MNHCTKPVGFRAHCAEFAVLLRPVKLLIKTAYVDFDGNGFITTVTPIPAVCPIERRGESSLGTSLLLRFPITGEVVARIGSFAVHIEVDLAAMDYPGKDELLALTHRSLDF